MTMSKDINHLVNMHHHYRSKMMRQQLLQDGTEWALEDMMAYSDYAAEVEDAFDLTEVIDSVLSDKTLKAYDLITLPRTKWEVTEENNLYLHMDDDCKLFLGPDQIPLHMKYHIDGEQECGNFKAYQITTEHNTLLFIVVNKYYQKL